MRPVPAWPRSTVAVADGRGSTSVGSTPREKARLEEHHPLGLCGPVLLIIASKRTFLSGDVNVANAPFPGLRDSLCRPDSPQRISFYRTEATSPPLADCPSMPHGVL